MAVDTNDHCVKEYYVPAVYAGLVVKCFEILRLHVLIANSVVIPVSRLFFLDEGASRARLPTHIFRVLWVMQGIVQTMNPMHQLDQNPAGRPVARPRPEAHAQV